MGIEEIKECFKRDIGTGYIIGMALNISMELKDE